MHFRRSCKKPMLRSAFAGSLLALASASLVAQSPCKPSEELQAKFRAAQAKPTAALYNELGIWYASHQQYDCATDALGQSLQLEPSQPDLAHVAFMFGASLFLGGQTNDAVTALQEVEKMGYRNITLHLMLAQGLDTQHQLAEAEKEWRAAIDIDWENSPALDGLSADLLADNDFAAVIQLLEDPKIVSQRTAAQSLNLGRAYALSGKLDQAARVLMDGLNTTPDSQPLARELNEVGKQLRQTIESAPTPAK
jgi:Flp pilus assembly protein TadD